MVLSCAAMASSSSQATSLQVLAEPGRKTSRSPCVYGHAQAMHSSASSLRRQRERSCGMMHNLCSRLERRTPTSGVTVGNASRRSLEVNALFDLDAIDRQKFEELPSKRRVFDFADWQKHRSTSRHVRHIMTTLDSRVIQALWPPVLFLTGVASFVVGFNYLVLLKELPAWVPLLHMSALPFQLTSPALSFLLVFRTNSSYGRFDEVRKMWGLMLNRSRDITRQALSYMARGEYAHEKPRRDQFLRHMQALPIVIKHHFLQEGDLEEELRTETRLSADEILGITSSKHRPNYTLQMMSECMRSCHMEPIHRVYMDQNLTTFADDVGGCERIFKTPIPLSYTRLTSRFLVLWHLFLPFGIYDACGWLTIPATFLSAFVLFCVDEVGVIIEEPFTVLALNAIATSARTNIAELMELHEQMAGNVEEPQKLSGAPGVEHHAPVPSAVFLR